MSASHTYTKEEQDGEGEAKQLFTARTQCSHCFENERVAPLTSAPKVGNIAGVSR